MKTGYIMCGAGMRSAYTAGSILGIVDKFGLVKPESLKPEVVITGSGTTGGASCFVSGQYNFIDPGWTGSLSTKKFINKYRVGKVVDIDYLVDDILMKKYPLDIKAMMSSGIDYYITATNAKTGIVEFLPADKNIREATRATMALPIFYGKSVSVGGEKYLDTYLSSTGIGIKMKKMLELGVDKVIVFSSSKSSKFFENVFNVWAYSQKGEFYKNYKMQENINYQMQECMKYIPSRDLEIVHLKPTVDLEGSLLDNDPEVIRGLINRGYVDTFNNKDLKKFFGV